MKVKALHDMMNTEFYIILFLGRRLTIILIMIMVVMMMRMRRKRMKRITGRRRMRLFYELGSAHAQ